MGDYFFLIRKVKRAEKFLKLKNFKDFKMCRCCVRGRGRGGKSRSGNYLGADLHNLLFIFRTKEKIRQNNF